MTDLHHGFHAWESGTPRCCCPPEWWPAWDAAERVAREGVECG